MDKIEQAAKRVCLIQSEYDGADLYTTGVNFMQENGEHRLDERNKILGAIDARRTEAIWSLDRIVSCQR